MAESSKKFIARVNRCLPVHRRASKKYEAAVAKATRKGRLDLAAVERARRAYRKAMRGCARLF